MRRNRIKYFLIILVFCSSILSGCSLNKNKSSGDTDWKNEILLAQSCGMDGLMCCPDKDPQCQFGQECCVDPNDSKRNFCADACNFGTEGSFCRSEGEKCDSGLVCSKGNCTSCGGDNEPCCASEDRCSGEFICHKDMCLQCGEPGNPCCGEQEECFAKDEYNSRLECKNAICTFCGSAGGIACGLSAGCDDWHLLNNSRCLPCGTYNQPCCREDGEFVCKNADLECRVGFCANK